MNLSEAISPGDQPLCTDVATPLRIGMDHWEWPCEPVSLSQHLGALVWQNLRSVTIHRHGVRSLDRTLKLLS